MKKILCVLFVNILLIAGIYFPLKYYFVSNPEFNFLTRNAHGHPAEVDYGDFDFSLFSEAFPEDFKRLEITDESSDKFCGTNRRIFGSEYTKKPVIILGCSYAYGHGLKNEQTFPRLLSELSKRPVINYASCGETGTSTIGGLYRETADDPELKRLLASSEYVVYVYMNEHISRYLTLSFLQNDYKTMFLPKGAENFIANFYLPRILMSAYRISDATNDFPSNAKSDKYLKSILLNINKHVNSFAPNAKFITVIYDEKFPSDMYSPEQIKFLYEKMNSPLWDDFARETGSTVVHTRDLTGFYFDKNYKLKEDIAGWHPNAKAWEVLTPLFVDKYIKD